MKKIRWILLIVLMVLILLIIGGTILIQQMNRGLDQLNEIEIQSIDLMAIEDRTYVGTYHAFPIDVEVMVTVYDHAITAIEITKHVNGQGQAGEEVIQHVIDEQSLAVNLIQGATYSSKVILLAIEDALTS